MTLGNNSALQEIKPIFWEIHDNLMKSTSPGTQLRKLLQALNANFKTSGQQRTGKLAHAPEADAGHSTVER